MTGAHQVTRRSVLRAIGVGVGASLLAACAPISPSTPAASSAGQTAPASPVAAGDAHTGGTLRVGQVGDIIRLEGHMFFPQAVQWNVFDRLMEYDSQMQPQPSLATSWQVSQDYRQVTLKLRQGVRFHSGRDFTSEDVRQNLLRTRDPKLVGNVGQLTAQSNWWTGIETPDPYTVVLSSDQPRPGVFDFFQYFNIIDTQIAAGPDGDKKLVGTGPFLFQEWVQGDHLTFTRNPNYWRSDRPYLDGFVVQVYTDPQALGINLESGSLDLVDTPPIVDIDRLTSNGAKFNLIKNDASGEYFWIGANTTRPPTDNKALRQAINYAIDRKRWTDVIMRGLVGQPQDLPWATTATAADPSKNNIYSFDLDKSKALIAEAGLQDIAFDITYGVGGFAAEFAQLAQVLQADLAQIGISTSIKPLEGAAFNDAQAKVDYNGVILGNGPVAHLVESSSAFTLGRSLNLQINPAGYHDQQLSDLIAHAATEPDAATRKQIYGHVNDILLDESYIMPISIKPNFLVTSPKVHGVEFIRVPETSYTNTWLG